MRILVLGGTGFFGPHVVARLVNAGHDVAVYHRGETEAELPGEVRHVHGSFDAMPVSELRALGPEVVLDMVPFVRADAERLRSFRGCAQRAVAISSCDVYRAYGRLHQTEPGPPDPLPLREGSPLRTVVIDPTYDKVGVEEELSGDAELPVTIVRAPATHGPGDPQHRLYRYVRRMADRRPAILLDNRIRDWRWVRGHVENVAEAISLAVTTHSARDRVYNVADRVTYSEAEWVRRIGDVFGWEGTVVSAPAEQLPESLRAGSFDLRQDFVVDSSRIRAELGYREIVDEEEALRRTIDWELAHPPASSDDPFDYETEDRAVAAANERA